MGGTVIVFCITSLLCIIGIVIIAAVAVAVVIVVIVIIIAVATNYFLIPPEILPKHETTPKWNETKQNDTIPNQTKSNEKKLRNFIIIIIIAIVCVLPGFAKAS